MRLYFGSLCFNEFWLGLTGDQARAYRRLLSPLDPVNCVRDRAGSSMLFQFATNDFFIAASTAERLYQAAQGPRAMLF